MAVTSQNGYLANDPSITSVYTVPGVEKAKFRFRTGDTAVVLCEFIRRYNLEVAPIDGPVLDDWSFAERPIRGSSTELSNHASGTAVDLNAIDHPLGHYGTFSTAELAALRRLLSFFEGVLRWGGDYTGRKDEMHVEINADWPAVTRVANKIRSLAATPAATLPDVGGDIGKLYVYLGGGRSALGAPLPGGELIVGVNGRRRDFEHGAIWWRPDLGAAAVYGDILYVAYAGLGWETGVLGFPTTSEASCSLGRGRYNFFEHGGCWWTAETGAHAVYGDILTAWAAAGYETTIGYPVDDEHDVPGGRAQTFEHATLTWVGGKVTQS